MVRVAVVGVSGYSGMELARLASRRPEIELVGVYGDRWKNEPLRGRVDVVGAAVDLTVEPADALVRSFTEGPRPANGADIVVMATPAEVSAELAPQVVKAGLRAIDLSGAFRIRDLEVFRAYYGFEHPAPELVASARYALPQLPVTAGDAPPITEAKVVSNPGCYATAAILPLAPLLEAGLLDGSALFVDGKSGVTGAGRKVAEKYLFTEVAENVSPYRVANHQHTPEIEQALSRAAGSAVSITFAPHLLPVKRGLIATSFGRLAKGASAADVAACLSSFVASARSPLGAVLELGKTDEVTIASVAFTERARLGVTVDEARGTFVTVCAIDNLLKGAASQALENLLEMIGAR